MAEEKGKSIQEIIQQFCEICSRGVIVSRESMFRCKQCRKEVCHECFDKELRLCAECAKPERDQRMRTVGIGVPEGTAESGRPRAAASDPPRARGEREPNPVRSGIWLVAIGLLLFGGGLLANVHFDQISNWLIVPVAIIGLLLFVRGLFIVISLN